MEKKNYLRPIMKVERFIPNDYVAACYHVHCKTDASNSDYTHVYWDTNGDGEFNSGDKLAYSDVRGFTGCDITHKGVLSDKALTLNGFVVKYDQFGRIRKTQRVYVWEQETEQYGNIHVCYDPTSAEYIADRPNAS